eukprot:7609275-Pyramimonas_sp.AAC.1
MQRDGTGWKAGDRAQARLFQRQFPHLTEVYQEQDTSREVRDGAITHSARLDRAYTSLPQAIIRDLDIRCGVLGKLKAKMASVHIPMFIDIEPYRPQDGPKTPRSGSPNAPRSNGSWRLPSLKCPRSLVPGSALSSSRS